MKKYFAVLKPNKVTVAFFLCFLLLTWLAYQGGWVFRSPRETGEPRPFMYNTLKPLYSWSLLIFIVLNKPAHFLVALLQRVFSSLDLLYWPIVLGYFYILSLVFSRLGSKIFNKGKALKRRCLFQILLPPYSVDERRIVFHFSPSIDQDCEINQVSPQDLKRKGRNDAISKANPMLTDAGLPHFGMRQKDIAEKLGISQGALSQIYRPIFHGVGDILLS